ncbi:MAG: hypothetical protein JNM24_07390 [Bdellovibrionaceae bacterium]|nr:hypothetical protein [Pseudobdellovibrionaceae bacterium]
MNNLSQFIIFFAIFSILGCTTYSRNSEEKAVRSKKPSSINVSLSFIEGTSGYLNRSEIRIDQNFLADKITKELEDLNLFKSINRDIESYESPSDVVIEVVFNSKLTFGDPRYGIFLPIPERHTKSLIWKVYDKNGLRKQYESSINYEVWRFFLLFPAGIYQSVTKEKYFAENILIQDILKKMKNDVEVGNF